MVRRLTPPHAPMSQLALRSSATACVELSLVRLGLASVYHAACCVHRHCHAAVACMLLRTSFTYAALVSAAEASGSLLSNKSPCGCRRMLACQMCILQAKWLSSNYKRPLPRHSSA